MYIVYETIPINILKKYNDNIFDQQMTCFNIYIYIPYIPTDLYQLSQILKDIEEGHLLIEKKYIYIYIYI